ncbi:NAD(P)/FAD-dependent oxidoreductase [Sodalis sp. RH21]|uniref:NAD(P)/FAD-dependent oxidoreductase n=1 Tax=unclassified Sodalis (in: enterobacteria) TaxID=2636512 RepID=UPI0039B4942A
MTRYDIAIVGGGIMGCYAAMLLAEAGMRVAVIEKSTLCGGASGVNAGSHSMQNKRLQLLPYALEAQELWTRMSARLGYDMGYRRTGGLIVALTEQEAAGLEEKTLARRAVGVDAEMIAGDRARAIEPLLSQYILAASYGKTDGYSDSLRTGRAFTGKLRQLGVSLYEHCGVERIAPVRDGFVIAGAGETVYAGRILLAAGAWLKELLLMLGSDLPVSYRLNQALVLDRIGHRLRGFIGHASGLLTLKQSHSGKLLLGGGWPAEGCAQAGESVMLSDSIIGNLRLARRILPAVGATSLLRAWSGFEADMPDFLPLVGAVPGVKNAFVIGCIGGGYTLGPVMAQRLCQQILERGPADAAFDPARFLPAGVRTVTACPPVAQG